MLASFDYFRIQVLILSLLSSAGILLGSVQLDKELSRREGPGIGSVIARVKEFSGIVQRKRARRYSWSRVEVEDGFYHRESLQTGDRSEVQLQIISKQGSLILKIEENSLVVFNADSEFGLEVIDGAIEIQKDDLEFRVFKDVDKVKKIEINIELSTPTKGEDLFTLEKTEKKVRLMWDPKILNGRPINDLFIEVSKDPNFIGASVYLKEMFSEKEAVLTLGAGHYYWRLNNSEEALSRTGHFNIIEVKALKLISIESEKDAGAEFYWSIPEFLRKKEVGQHQIQIASDPFFDQVIKEFKIIPSSEKTSLYQLGEGSFFVRIKSDYSEISLYSKMASFKIKDGKVTDLSILKENNESKESDRRDLLQKISKEKKRIEDKTELNSSLVESEPLTEEEIKIENDIAIVNDDGKRFELSLLAQEKNLLLSWIYPEDGLIKSWEIWKASVDGSPKERLGSEIGGTTRAANLSLDEVSAGTLLVVVGNLSVGGYILSTVVQYSLKAPQPLASIEVQDRLTVYKDESQPFNRGTVRVKWKSAGSADYYVVRLFQGTITLSSTIIGAGQSEALLYFPLDVNNPNIKADIRAVRGNQYSSAISDSICLADITGDNNVDKEDLNYIDENLGKLVDYSYSDSSMEVGGKGDIAVDGVIDVKDQIIVKFFYGNNCL